jgi:hypothetical protein
MVFFILVFLTLGKKNIFQCLNIFRIFFLHICRKQFQTQNKFNSNKNNLNKLKQSIKLFKKEYKGYKVSLLN